MGQRRIIILVIAIIVPTMMVLWATTLKIGQSGEDLEIQSDHIDVGTSPPISEKMAISGNVRIDGQLDMNSHRIVNVFDLVNNQDAETEHYANKLAGNGSHKMNSISYKIYRPFHP